MTNSSAPGQRFAICIGIKNHPLDARLPSLDHAEEDAQAFYDLLDSLNVPEANRKLLLGSQATIETINLALDKLLRKEPRRRDFVIFYYAGYVIPLVENVIGETAQARLDVLLATADIDTHIQYVHDHGYHSPLLGMHTLRGEFIDDSLARHQLFILDCYPTPSTVDQHTVSEDIQWITERVSQLMQYSLPGRFAITSCIPAESALDPVTNKQRFSSYVLKVLRGEVQEALRKDQTLTVQRFCAHVSAQLLLLNQHYMLSDADDDFVIKRYPRGISTVPLPYNSEAMPQTGDLPYADKPLQEVLPVVKPAEVFIAQVDVVIITIREDEFRSVLRRFPAEAQSGASGRTYGICQIRTKTGKNCRVAVVRSSEQGNDTAQQVANDVISDLKPQMLLVVGIAGGVPHDDFTLGDVVISSRIDNLNVSKRYEDGREAFDIRGGIHPDISNIAASLPLYQKELVGWNDPVSIKLDRPEIDFQQFETKEMQEKLADNHKNTSWYKKLRASITTQLGDTKNSTRHPHFITGTIASSNSVIHNIDLLVQWLQNAHSILAIEMEAAGVYMAAQKIKEQYKVMAIRGISDIIGFGRDNQWTKYACETAAAFAYAFVTAGIITPREDKISSNGSTTDPPQPTK